MNLVDAFVKKVISGPYEEYGKLRKHDVCELVKKRIQEKLDELKEADPRR